MRASQNYLLVERLAIIRESIESGFYPSTTKLKKNVLDKLGVNVSVQTLFRDLNFLRYRCGIEIQYDSSRRGYYIKKN